MVWGDGGYETQRRNLLHVYTQWMTYCCEWDCFIHSLFCITYVNVTYSMSISILLVSWLTPNFKLQTPFLSVTSVRKVLLSQSRANQYVWLEITWWDGALQFCVFYHFYLASAQQPSDTGGAQSTRMHLSVFTTCPCIMLSVLILPDTAVCHQFVWVTKRQKRKYDKIRTIASWDYRWGKMSCFLVSCKYLRIMCIDVCWVLL